jgi:hypothetical protein
MVLAAQRTMLWVFYHRSTSARPGSPMLVTMMALSYRQIVLNGAKERPLPGPAHFGPNRSVASPVRNQRRAAGSIKSTRATVRPEGNNR